MEQNDSPFFVIDDNPIVEWPVKVSLPVAGGKFADFQFNVLMKVLSPTEYEQLFKDAPGAAKGDDAIVPKLSEIVTLNVPIFQRLITGWSGVKDAGGNEVAFTPEKLAEQTTGPRGPALSAGLWRAINEVRYGARLGN